MMEVPLSLFGGSAGLHPPRTPFVDSVYCLDITFAVNICEKRLSEKLGETSKGLLPNRLFPQEHTLAS
jgi:hypothetical protein